jgi:hypothetical protein
MSKKQSGGFLSTRREFAKTLAALAATPLFARLSPANARGGTPAIDPEDWPQEGERPPMPDAEALTHLVKIRYGNNLTEDQLVEVRRSIEGRLRSAAAMHKFKLANGDEPAFVFSATQK